MWKFPTGVVDEVCLNDKFCGIYESQIKWNVRGKKTKVSAARITAAMMTFYPQGEDICDAAVREVKEETGVSENSDEISCF